MSMICVICQDSLLGVQEPTTRPRTPAVSHADNIVSATCGHMIHQTCLQEWFRAEDTRQSTTGTFSRKSCPYCQREVDHVGFFRIYPIFEEMPGPVMPESASSALKEKCEDLGKLVCFLENEIEMLKQEQIIGKYSGKSGGTPEPPGPKKKSRNIRPTKSKMADKPHSSSVPVTATATSSTSADPYPYSAAMAAHMQRCSGSDIDNQIRYSNWRGVPVQIPAPASTLSASAATFTPTAPTTSSGTSGYPSNLNSTPYRHYYPPPLSVRNPTPSQATPYGSQFYQPYGTNMIRAGPARRSSNYIWDYQTTTAQTSSATAPVTYPRVTYPHPEGTRNSTISTPTINTPLLSAVAGPSAPPPAIIYPRVPYPYQFYNRVGQQNYPDPRGPLTLPPSTSASASASSSRDSIITSSSQYRNQASTSTSTNYSARYETTFFGGSQHQSASVTSQGPSKPWEPPHQPPTFDFDSIVDFALERIGNPEPQPQVSEIQD